MFLVPMESTADWASAFRSLLNQKINGSGRTPAQWLGLAAEEHLESELDPSSMDAPARRAVPAQPASSPDLPDIVNALIALVRKEGPALLLLDNLDEGPDRFLSSEALAKVFPQGIPKEIHLHTAKTFLTDIEVLARICYSSIGVIASLLRICANR